MRSTLFKLSVLYVLGAFLVIGCGSDSEDGDGPSADCRTSVESISSPSAGFAMLHGSFYSDESVIIQETDGTVIAQGTPDSDRSTFTLSGVPSGDNHYEIIISCDAGRNDLGTFQFQIT
jgi:hypothetical protein